MRIIARRTLRDFVNRLVGHKDQAAVRGAVDAWFAELSKSTWSGSAELKKAYATASIVTSDRVVFNIKGNSYRLVAAIDFERQILWIKWIGSHRDYDRIDVTKVEHGD